MLERFRVFGHVALGARGELLQAVQDAYGDFFPADGAAAAVLLRLLRGEAEMAVAVPVQMIFSLFGKKFDGSRKTLARIQRAFERGIRDFRIEQIAFSA